MSDLEDFVEFIIYTRRFKIGHRRYLRDCSNPFEKYSVREFYSRYRVTPQGVKNILLPMLESDLKKPSMRGLPFAPEIMLLITLRYFATGSVQKLGGDVNVSQQSVSRIIPKVSVLIARKMKDFVKFPATSEDVNKVIQKFYEIAQFPGVVGCIDCTHIKIKSPGGASSELYKNRKGWYSINVQAVAGPNLEFYDLVARWPGSTHDSFIYSKSRLKQRLEDGSLKGILLGDNGYEVGNVLLTPFLAPSSSSQDLYNRCHYVTHNTITRAFESWKRRFPCLHVGMGIKVDTVMAVICACATLHNLGLKYNQMTMAHSDNEDSVDTNVDTNVDALPIPDDPYNSVSMVRQSLVDQFFSNHNML